MQIINKFSHNKLFTKIKYRLLYSFQIEDEKKKLKMRLKSTNN